MPPSRLSLERCGPPARTPGGSIQGKLVGLPGAEPLGLFVGSGILDPPIPTPWGEFFIASPYVLFTPLGVLPPGGVLTLPATLPPGMSVPVDVPMQAFIGDVLTQLWILQV